MLIVVKVTSKYRISSEITRFDVVAYISFVDVSFRTCMHNTAVGDAMINQIFKLSYTVT